MAKLIFVHSLDYGCSPIIKRIGKRFNESNICNNSTIYDSKKSAIYGQLEQFLTNTSSKCIKPCKTITYAARFREMNTNTRLLAHSKNYSWISFGLHYDEFMVDLTKEYFVMSPGALVSTIGGFLGLFLGFSCLSITFWITDLAKKYMK